MKKEFIFITLTVIFFLFVSTNEANAAITSLSDTISTSRVSSGTVLTTDQAASATVIVTEDNGSMFIASDSAMIRSDVGETGPNTINVASMSAKYSSSPVKRDVFFTAAVTNAHHKGDAVIVPITAMHKIQFTTTTGIPASGHIVITFPGTVQNIASPSASTFDFNGITTTQIAWNNVTCTSVTVSSSGVPSIDCLLNGSAVAAGTTVTVLIGCTGQAGGVCNASAISPRLINPIQVSSTSCIDTGTCTADTWKVMIKTQDAGPNDIDTAMTKIGTIQPVLVQAYVEPTLTFTINGIAAATTWDTKGSGCNADKNSSGIDTTATNVNLGLLGTGISQAAQQLQVATNTKFGYVVTATSSGRFLNPASGYYVTDANAGNGLTANDVPAPAVINAGTPDFGISPCGTTVTTSPDWAKTSSIGAGAKLSNPWNSQGNGFYATLASTPGTVASTDNIVVRYGATVSSAVPPGNYFNYFTYVATVTF